jgi:hypothetical protein
MLTKLLKHTPFLLSKPRYCFVSTDGATFLQMVEGFFDRAAVHTGIRTDRLIFYKKAENVVKCSIPLVRGNFGSIQMTALSRPFVPIAASTKLINCPRREGLVTLKTWTLKKWKPSPV